MKEEQLKHRDSLTRIDEQFLKAIQTHEIVIQYELLNAGVKDSDTAGKLLKVAEDHLEGDEKPLPIDWDEIRKRAGRVRLAQWLMGSIYNPSGIAGTIWRGVLIFTAIVSAAGAAIFLTESLRMPTEDSAFRGGIFLAAFFLGVTILSGLALITQDSSTISPRQHKDLGRRKIVLAVFQTVVIGTAATAVVILSLVWRPNPGTWTANISPGDPFRVEIPARADVVAVMASEADAKIILRVTDRNQKEISRVADQGSVRATLPEHKTGQLKVEVSANRFTGITVSARSVHR